MRVSAAEFKALPLEAHAVLRGVPLRDVTAVDLPDTGGVRTVDEVRSRMARSRPDVATRALFGTRWAIGRLFGWDAPAHRRVDRTYLDRVTAETRARSTVPPGTPQGPFRVLYVLERESLAEIRNATVHGFLCVALVRTAAGYRLYFAVYVRAVSRLTPYYMAVIEPFRRFIVYPAMMRRARRAWSARDAA